MGLGTVSEPDTRQGSALHYLLDLSLLVIKNRSSTSFYAQTTLSKGGRSTESDKDIGHSEMVRCVEVAERNQEREGADEWSGEIEEQKNYP